MKAPRDWAIEILLELARSVGHDDKETPPLNRINLGIRIAGYSGCVVCPARGRMKSSPSQAHIISDDPSFRDEYFVDGQEKVNAWRRYRKQLSAHSRQVSLKRLPKSGRFQGWCH